jgi:ABC-2 type transport system ATP-binding protein
MADRMMMISRGQQKLYGEVDAIRNQYALHAIVVEGQGDWESLEGVDHVEYSQNGRKGALLHLKQESTSDDVLGAIARAQNVKIERFELAIPSLDEIFIQVAGEGKNNG